MLVAVRSPLPVRRVSDDLVRKPTLSAMKQPIRYMYADEDSARWLDFAFRDDDIVISTRSKSGTTWVQMICALLILQTPDLPRPLAELSPWLDWLVVPKDKLFADLEAQRLRRFIKTHTPLDGLPIDDRVTYIVVARHPLDAAVSLYHQSGNINRARMAELTGKPDIAMPNAAAAGRLARQLDRIGCNRSGPARLVQRRLPPPHRCMESSARVQHRARALRRPAPRSPR